MWNYETMVTLAQNVTKTCILSRKRRNSVENLTSKMLALTGIEQ